MRYSGKAELQAFLFFVFICADIIWLIVIYGKINFSLRSASWVIKTAQPMVNSTSASVY